MNLGGFNVNEVFLLSIVCVFAALLVKLKMKFISFLSVHCPRFDSLRVPMRQVAQERLREFDKVKGDSQKLFCCIMSSDVKALCRACAVAR